MAGVLSFAGALGLWGWRILDPFWRLGDGLLMSSGFCVKEVIVSGRVRTPPEDIWNILGIGKDAGVSIFNVSPAAARKKLEALPWVRCATVTRWLPGMVQVNLLERQPVAIWQHHQRLYLIDERGEKIACPRTAFPKGLVLVVGERAPGHFFELPPLFEALKEVPMKVRAAVFLRSLRWDLHLSGDIIVKLPKDEPEKALRKLPKLLHLTRPQHVTIFDLRFGDSVLLEVRPLRVAEGGKGS